MCTGCYRYINLIWVQWYTYDTKKIRKEVDRFKKVIIQYEATNSCGGFSGL